MPKAEARKAWQRSNGADRAGIVAAVLRYAAWLRSQTDHPFARACRFITQRRIDGFGEPEPAMPMRAFHARSNIREREAA